MILNSTLRGVAQARWLCTAFLVAVLMPSEHLQAQPGDRFVFRDVGTETGFLPAASGIMGHGAAWGDVDGDGWADLYVATFHYTGQKPNLLLWNREGRFELAQQPNVRISTRATGVVFADLDNDGDLDLYVASMPAPEGSRLAVRMGHAFEACSLFRNDDGRFTNVSKGNAACPAGFGGRSATVLDIDGDGLLDLLVGEDPIPGYNGSKTKTSRLFRNRGGLKFEDISQAAGIPENAAGLGVAAGDVNRDGWPDFFLASTLGNFLMLNDGKGRFHEAPGVHDTFHWPAAKGDDMICGVAIADVNNDQWPDILLGQHFESPWVEPVANRLYLNLGWAPGEPGPTFQDVTEKSGLVPLPLKGPHVEIQDFDNDGRPDIYTSIVKFADGRPHPFIFHNLGLTRGRPKFECYALTVNDFPNAADKAVKRSGPFFEKMVADRKIVYTAPGPTCDFDRDGRLDMVLPNWWGELPSLLLKNETESGNWIDVRVEAGNGVNRMGIGSQVNVYAAGQAGGQNALLGSREIATGFGYASSQEAVAHFGLGERTTCDIVVTLPHGRGQVVRKDVEANQRIVVTGP